MEIYADPGTSGQYTAQRRSTDNEVNSLKLNLYY